MTVVAGRWTAIASRVEGGIGWVAPIHGVDADARVVTTQALEAVADHAGNPDVQAVVLSDFRDGLVAKGPATDDASLATLYQKVTALICRSSKTLVIRPASDHGATSSSLPCYIEPLTFRERQVLSLWAGGLSARDVGNQLFISERTVESHVSNGYRKLGINSRIELIKRAAEFGL
jgi:DNA-binding NarL/FixJ family response regulator